MNNSRLRSIGLTFGLVIFYSVALTLLAAPAAAQVGTLAQPLSPPSPNAALHYQRGLLYLQAIGKDQRQLLEKPIWETLVAIERRRMDGELRRLLYQGRLALRSASTGARLEVCDFGIDFRSHGPATPLPHVGSMVELGRLMTLRAAYEMSRGNWEESGVILFDGLRIGRHLAHQPTVAEAIAGMEVLTNNYWALAHWACACPEPAMVARGQRLLETIAADLVDPTKSVTGEMSILRRRLDGLRAAYPSGPWAELILEELGEEIPAGSPEEIRAEAKRLCLARGVNESVFESHGLFVAHVTRVHDVQLRFSEAVAACMTLPPIARAKKAERIYENYTRLAGAIGETLVLDPVELGSLFAVHQAELALLRVTLAMGAKRNQETGAFPKSLESIDGVFGGAVPVSPYDGGQLEFETLGDGKDIYLAVRGAGGLPRVSFSSEVPADIGSEAEAESTGGVNAK